MKPADIFGVIVRTIGFGVIVWGLWNWGDAIALAFQLILEFINGGDSVTIGDLSYPVVNGVLAPVLGFLILGNASHISQWAYREKTSEKPDRIPPKLESLSK